MAEQLQHQKAPESREGLEYDFYKFFFLVSLLVLSGIVTMAASPVVTRVPDWLLIGGALLAISSAAASFACQMEIVRLASRDQRRRRLTLHGRKIITAFFIIAMATFLLLVVILTQTEPFTEQVRKAPDVVAIATPAIRTV